MRRSKGFALALIMGSALLTTGGTTAVAAPSTLRTTTANRSNSLAQAPPSGPMMTFEYIAANIVGT